MLAGRTGNPSPSGVKSRFAAIMEPTRDRDDFLMTTKTEQRQAIWYVTGLAEVLVGPADPGRFAADLGQPAHVARAVGEPRSLALSDWVLEHRLEAGVTIGDLAHRTDTDGPVHLPGLPSFHGLTLDGRRDHGV